MMLKYKKMSMAGLHGKTTDEGKPGEIVLMNGRKNIPGKTPSLKIKVCLRFEDQTSMVWLELSERREGTRNTVGCCRPQ